MMAGLAGDIIKTMRTDNHTLSPLKKIRRRSPSGMCRCYDGLILGSFSLDILCQEVFVARLQLFSSPNLHHLGHGLPFLPEDETKGFSTDAPLCIVSEMSVRIDAFSGSPFSS